ncbi:MAG: F0F1 ATP synthase subunit epsilon [Corynebacterium sp.]|nr:F0F1 ATP synthase subunit epsilon [Corynebacterium sp.]
MASVTTELVAVEGKMWSGEASLVTAQTTEGEIGILPGHEPILGQLVETGVVTITPVDGDKKVAAVHGGFLSVSKDRVTVLADYAVWAEDVDAAEAERILQSSESEDERQRAQAQLHAVQRVSTGL